MDRCKNPECEARVNTKSEPHVYQDDMLFCSYGCAVDYMKTSERLQMAAEPPHPPMRPPSRRLYAH